MATRATKIAFPKVRTGTTYTSFLQSLMDMKTSNRRAFALAKQSEILEEFERQLKEAYPHDESAVRKRMEEARSSKGHGAWNHWHSSLSYLVKQRDDAGETGALDLPKVGRAHGAKDDVFDKQTYADFALKAKQKNVEFVFTKEAMDRAFTLAAEMAKKKVFRAHPTQYDRMMSRCLGKESEEYWKKK